MWGMKYIDHINVLKNKEKPILEEQDVGYRKIQCVGRGSHIISLPKGWILDHGLKKGSQLLCRIQEDSSLLLIPREILEKRKAEEKPRLREFTLTVSSKDDPGSICRKIIALYVISADMIHIRFKDGDFIAKHKASINDLVRNTLLGSEIIDEKPNEITLQILINHSEFPVEKAIRRMLILAISADKEVISSFISLDEAKIRNIMDTYKDVNRLNLYVIRQLKYCLERNLFKDLEFKSPKEFLGYRIVVNDIRGIAKNSLNIAKNIMALKRLVDNNLLILKEPVDEEVSSQITQFNSSAHQLFEDSMKALFKRDVNLANEIISKVEASVTLENDLVTLISSKKMDPNVSSILRLIIDNSRRLMEYSQNVAEITLNRAIEEISSIFP